MSWLLDNAVIVLSALLLDAVLGETKRGHPLVMFGHYAARCEAWFYPKQQVSNSVLFIRGAVCWCVAVLLPSSLLVGLYLICTDGLQAVLAVIYLYFAIGARSLAEHGNRVSEPLLKQDITQARAQLNMIVSRDTQDLNEAQISSATVETITENTHDAVIAPIFWFLVLGVAGVILFRLANTLDAMWGYKNKQYEYFGKFSARVDDVLGWPSARVTVCLFILVSALKGRLKGFWRIYLWGRSWYSPNAGPVMAAGAFALNVRLGGPAPYHGVLKSRPWLGGDGLTARVPTAADITQAIQLMHHSSYALVSILFVVGTIQWLY